VNARQRQPAEAWRQDGPSSDNEKDDMTTLDFVDHNVKAAAVVLLVATQAWPRARSLGVT
jgi:hypothetical protein